MKKMRTVLIIILSAMLLASCLQEEDLPPAEEQTVSNIANKIQNIRVSKDTLITLTDLEDGVLYGIYPSATKTGRSLSPREGGQGLISTKGGTYLHPSDGHDFSFHAGELGIREQGTLGIIKYNSKTGDRKIDTESDTPLYFIEERGKTYPVYEEYYVVSLKEKGLDPSRVALMNYSIGNGSFSTDYGVIDPSYGSLSNDPELNGIMDFSSENEIGIFNQVIRREGYRTQEIIPLSPILLENGQSVDITPLRNLYEIRKSSCKGEMVIELNIGTSNIWDYRFSSSATDGRIANGNHAGNRKTYIFPISYDSTSSSVLLYIGEVDEDFIFEIITDENVSSPGTAKLREITEKERSKIHFIEVKDGISETIHINAEDAFTPLIFTSSDSATLHAMQVKGDFTDNSYRVRMIYGHTNGKGYSQFSLENHEIKDSDFSNDVLEHAFITNKGNVEGDVTLSFSKTGFEPEEPPKVEDVIVDASKLSSGFTEVKFGENRNLVFANLEKGSIYGIYSGEKVSCRDERLIRVDRDFYAFLALDETERFDVSSFRVSGDTTLNVMKLNMSDSFSENTDDMKAVMATEDGDLYLNCFRFDIAEDGEYALMNQSLGSGSMSTSRYFINAATGEEIKEGISYNVYDFTGMESVIMISNIRLIEGNCINNFYLEKAQYCNSDDVPDGFRLPGFFKIEATGLSDAVIELAFDGYAINTDALRYPTAVYDDGSRAQYFYPFSVNANTNTVLLYAGKIDGTVSYIIDSYIGEANRGQMRIRQITEEEKSLIEVVSLSSSDFEKEIAFNEGLTLAIFEAENAEDSRNWKISCDSSIGNTDVALKLSRTGSSGTSSRSLFEENGYQCNLGEEEFIEAVLIKASSPGSVTLKFEKL